MIKTGPVQNKERGNIRRIKRKKVMPKPDLSKNERVTRLFWWSFSTPRCDQDYQDT